MAARARKGAPPAASLPHLWEKYGTWVLVGVTAVAVGILVGTLVRQHRQAELRKGEAELAKIARDDPTAAMQLEHLEREYGKTALGSRVRLKWAQALYLSADHEAAERRFNEVLGDEAALPLERAQAQLGLAYVAQEQGRLDEARSRYRKVKEQKLYAPEADRMLAVLDRIEKRRKAETGGTDGGEAPE